MIKNNQIQISKNKLLTLKNQDKSKRIKEIREKIEEDRIRIIINKRKWKDKKLNKISNRRIKTI